MEIDEIFSHLHQILNSHPHLPYLSKRWMLVIRKKMVANCCSKVIFKELPKLWWCMWSCFFHHIETSNLNNSKNPKPISKKASIFKFHIHQFSFKEPWKHFGFRTLSRLAFLQQTSKTRRFSNYKQVRLLSKNLQDQKNFKLHTSQVSFKEPQLFLGTKSIVRANLWKKKLLGQKKGANSTIMKNVGSNLGGHRSHKMGTTNDIPISWIWQRIGNNP